MHVTRSLRASAIFLSFSVLGNAWVLHRKSAGDIEQARGLDSVQVPRAAPVDGNVKKRQGETTELECPNDRWEQMLDANPDDRVKTFCNEWLGISPATVVEEVTPTITITTSASTTTVSTSTQRIITTTTVNETVVTTVVPLQRRAANIAAIAEDVISSVIVSGTATPTTSKSPQRLQAESGLANACSCKMVDPTATETSFFTVPPVYTTVGVRRVFVEQVTDTRVFTATTTVTETSEETASASGALSSGLFSNGTSTSAAQSSALPLEATSSSVQPSPATDVTESTSSPGTTIGPDPSGTVGSDSSDSVVTAIPFSCPDAAGKRVEQVVGGVRLDYLVLCDTELVTADRRRPIPVNSETECAAQCSLINAQTGQDTCQATSYEPNADGTPGGSCTITTEDPEYVDSPGSIAIIHTGTLANGNECANIDSTNGSSPSIDTSAAIAAVTSAPISLSTPGLVTQSANGGVFQTYVSANSTDASGYVHWSWYAVSASSSYWWAVYSTSWECTATLTRTIVAQPATPQTVVSVLITTIIHGATTTYVSGTSTRIVTNGDGIITPTFVPASTTEGEAGITTFFSEATATSTGQDGVATPSDEGPGNATVSFATSTFFSTASEGVIAPSSISPSILVETLVSSNGIQFSTSGSTYTSNGNGTEGVIPPPSATGGSAVFSTAGSTFTADSTGAGGIVIPGINTSASTFAPQTIQEVSNSTLVSGGTAALTVSGSTGTAVSTGDSGIVPPGSTTVVTVTVSVTSGGASFATSSSTFVTNGTGDSGIIPPASTFGTSGAASFVTSNSTLVASSTGGSGVIPPASSAFVTPVLIISSTGGNGNITIAGSTAVSFGTGDSGVIPPPPTDVSSLPIPTVTPGLEGNISVSVATAQFSTSNGTLVVLSTGGSGILPPSTVNVTTTTTTTVLGSTVAIPQVDISSTGGSGGFSVQGSAGTIFSTGGGGVIPPASVTPSPSLNVSSTASSTGPPFSNTDDNRFPNFSRRSSSATVFSIASTGGIAPSANSTFFSLPPSNTPSASLNVSSSSSGPPFTNSDNPRSPFPISSTTISLPPSATPSASLNVSSSSTGPPFTNSDNPRSPFPITRSSSTPVSLVPSGSIPVPSSNVTTNGVSSSSVGSISIPVSANSTAPAGTSPSGPAPSSSLPSPSNNVTTSAPPGFPTVVPPPFGGNFTVPIGTGFTVASVGTPVPSLNSTSTLPLSTGNITSFAPSFTPSVSLNITTSPVLPTGNSSMPSATPTVSLNSTTTPDICPTAPILITVTEVATSVQVITTTLIQTVTAGAEVSAVVDAFSTSVEVDVSATASDAAPSSSAAASIDLPVELRRSAVPATQAQIDSACANTSNIVLNPNFAVSDDGQVAGWSVNNTDPAITVGSEENPNGNGTIAQFKSAVVGRTLAITQPLTLCPGQQYEVSGLHRQAVAFAQCSVTYTVGDQQVLFVTPQTNWTESSAIFTAGQGVDGASVDLQVTASCAGFSGFPVADQEGYMRVEVSGVNVVQQRDASKRSIVERMTRSWSKRTTSVEAAKKVSKYGFGVFQWKIEE